MVCVVIVAVFVSTQSGCWKCNYTKLHTDLTPSQVYEKLQPDIQLGDPKASVERVMNRYYVLELDEELVTDSGGTAIAYFFRPPGWSMRGPMLKGGDPGVGERYCFVFDEIDRFIAIHNPGSADYPPDASYGSVHYPTSEYKYD